jgi:hypothetical protein
MGDRRDLINLMENVAIDPNDPEARETAFEIWRLAISEMSGVELTYEEDLLPVFQGIAKRMERAAGLTYAHGFWMEDIIPGISWHQQPHRRDLRDKIVSLQPLRRIPSWSWAASRGEYVSFYHNFLPSERFLATSHLASLRISWDDGLELKLEAPIKSYLLSQKYAGRRDFSDADFKQVESWLHGGVSKNELSSLADELIGSVAIDEYFSSSGIYKVILFYSCTSYGKRPEHIGILLRAVEGHKFTFRRIRLSYFSSHDFFPDADRVILTLI